MKNLVSVIFLLALMVSGCSQEEILKKGTSTSVKGRVFTTEFEQDDSRTYVKDGLYSRWTEGDLISLFDAGTLNCQYLFSGKTGDSSGNFFLLNKPEGTGMPLSANYAVYPYSEDVKMTEEGMISVTLPSEQLYAENSYGLGDNTMVAVTKDVDDTFLSFKNVGGCFKLQLYGDEVTVKSITLTGNNGEKIAGKATITAVYDGAPVVTMADDATTSITLDCGEKGVKIGASAEEATAFWVVVPPTTFEKGITVKVVDVNGKVFTQTTDKQLVIERNVVQPMAAVNVVAELDVEDLRCYYEENYLDSLDAVYCNKGYIALFGNADVPTVFDGSGNVSTSKERVLYIAKVNEQGDVDDTDATMVVVDSTNFPVRIVGKGINAILSRTNQNHFDILVYDSISDNWKEYNDIYFLNNVTDESTATRTLADAGSHKFTFTNVVSVFSYLGNVGGAIAGKGIAKLAPTVGIFGDILGSIGQDELGSGVAVTVGKLPGAIIGIVGYLSAKYDKLKKKFFCDENENVRISIESVNQIDKNTVEIGYDVQGLNEYGKANSDLFFTLTSWNNMTREVIFLPVENGYNKKILKNLEPDFFTLSLTLISRKWLLMYTTRPDVDFSIFDLEFDRYEFIEEPTYKNGEVIFKMMLYLNGDLDRLKDIQQFGYYIKYANTLDYQQVKHLSSIFAPTPVTYELKIPKEGFLGESMNYTTFEARPNIPYYIGVYVVLKNGNIVTFDEESLEGLVYDQKPSLSFTSASVVGTEIYYGDDHTLVETKFDISYKVNGTFWFDKLGFYIGGWGGNIMEIINSDGFYREQYMFGYLSDISDSRPTSLTLVGKLTNGGTFIGDMLEFYGNPITSVFIKKKQ